MATPLYVGVAGITSRAQADAVLAAIPPGFPRQVAIGVLASAKTLAGGVCNPRSPAPGTISEVFPDDPRALNLVHYFTRTTGDGLKEELCRAMAIGGINCHGLQLNIAWPDLDELQMFVAAYPAAWCPRVVLQLGPAALEAVDWNMHALVDRLREYVVERAISDVLLDVSAGTGRDFNDAKLISIVRALPILRAAYPDLGIVIAGGLSPRRLPDRALLRNVSIDVESGVRTDDALDDDKVRAFLGSVGVLLAAVPS